MADMKHCDNKKCTFQEERRGRPTIRTYNITMQNEKDASDVLYAHSTDLCPKCVKSVRTAMKKSIKTEWTEYTPIEIKAANGSGGKAKNPAAIAPVPNITGIGKDYDYLKQEPKRKSNRYILKLYYEEIFILYIM